MGGVSGNIAALHKLQAEMEFIQEETATSAADAVGIVLVEEIHRASIQVVGPVVEIHRYLPRPAFLAPRLAALTEATIDEHLAGMLDGVIR